MTLSELEQRGIIGLGNYLHKFVKQIVKLLTVIFPERVLARPQLSVDEKIIESGYLLGVVVCKIAF